MARLYEKASDKVNEHRIIDAACKKWGLGVQYTPVAYHLDGLFLIGKSFKARGFVEARKRNNSKNKYPTYELSLQKYIYINQAYLATNLNTCLLVEWEEGIHFISLNCEKFPIGWFKRNEQRDERDSEPCVEIPIDRFELL